MGRKKEKEKKEKEKLEDHYTLGKVLGKGSFGTVVQATAKDDGTSVAVKTIDRDFLYEQMKDDFAATSSTRKKKNRRKDFRRAMEREIDLLDSIDHDGVVRIVAHYREKGKSHLVLDLCDGPELHLVLQARGALSDDESRGFARQLCSVLAYLHGQRIVHLDIKPQNMMVVDPLPSLTASLAGKQLKLLDFGLAEVVGSRYLKKGKWHDRSDPLSLSMDDTVDVENKGTAAYQAPELTGDAVQLTVRQALLLDMFMLGAVLRSLLTGVGPAVFISHALAVTLGGLYRKGVKPLSRVPPAARELTALLMSVDSAQRPTADAALQHSWLKG